MAVSRAEKLLITGRIQGVGFRPFIYRLATQHKLHGWVRNRLGSVEIHIEGCNTALDQFAAAIATQAPPLARPQLQQRSGAEFNGYEAFEIRESCSGSEAHIHVPPDQFTCCDCIIELNDPDDRRYHYPFINCTQCGPRYSIIDQLPYDRPNTSMAGFELCPACRAEYQNPLDRRFHAQPLACPECGPQLHFRNQQGLDSRDNRAALTATIEALKGGEVVAVKGIGGYHLLCDAENEQAVRRLRHTKNRPCKPFALMVAESGSDGLERVREIATIDSAAAALLCDPLRPIVLVEKRSDTVLNSAIAPGLNEIGIMLPYSPLHSLLTHQFDKPLVATSGNLSGEPVLIDAAEVEANLYDVADAFLHHNRPIRRPVDDALFRIIAGKPRPLRIGRGNAPQELTLPFTLDKPLLALGGQNKVTVALAWQNRVVVSQHLGNLSSPRTITLFEQVIDELQRLYNVKAERIVCDAHPGYFSHRWARNHTELTHQAILHHHAHASALYGDRQLSGDALIFTWDGIGYGEDDTLWGGEALYGTPGRWQRIATLRPFSLPGGDKVALQPWRSAQSLCWEAEIPWQGNPRDNALLRHAWESGINCPRCSAAGRLFDAAAAFTGTLKQASYDGEAPMRLEAICRGEGQVTELPLREREDGVIESDWAPLLEPLMDSSRSGAERAADFHASMANTILDQARAINQTRPFKTIGLSGGVFQNRRLTEQTKAWLEAAGFKVVLHRQIASNDAGISYGQVIEAAAAASNDTDK